MAGTTTIGLLKAILSADASQFSAAMQNASKDVQALASRLQKDLEPTQRAVNAAMRDFLGGNEIRRAEEYAQAVQQIGGADKLVESDQLKVNKAVSEALQHFRALGVEAPKHLKDLEEATRSNQSVLASFGKEIVATATGFATGLLSVQAFSSAFRTMTDFVKESIQAVLEADKVERQLTAALAAQGLATPQITKQLIQLADAYQQSTVYSDEAIKSAEALLIQVGGVMPSQMDKALKAVTNLASGLGIDLRSATLMVAKAFEDNYTTLGRQGVQIDATRAKAEGMDYVLGQIQKKFVGQSQAEVESYAGQVQQLGNRWDEFKESVGRAFIQTGAMDTALALAKVGLSELELGLKQTIALLSTMPSLTDAIANPGLAGAKWAQRYAEALDILNKSALDTVKAFGPVASHLSAEETAANAAAKAAKDKAEADKIAAKAAKEHAEAIKGITDKLSAAGLKKELAETTEALQKMAKQGIAVNKAELPGLIEDIQKWRAAGLTIPPIYKDSWVAAAAYAEIQKLVTSSTKDTTQGFENLWPALVKNRDEFEKLEAGWQKWFITSNSGQFLKIWAQVNQVDLKKLVPPADKWREFDDALMGSAEAFRDLAQTADGAMADFARQLGIVFAAMKLAEQGSQQMLAGWKQLHGESKNVAAGFTNIAAGALEAYAAIDQATQSLDPKKNAAMGALAGAKAGAAFAPFTGGLSIAVGAGIGALVGALRDGHEKTRKEILAWATDLAGGINELHDVLTRMGRDDLFGKLTQGNAQQNLAAASELQGLLDLLKKYGLSLDDLTPANDRFGKSLADLSKDYDQLKRMGFGDAAIAKGMAAGLNDAVRAAIDLGQKLPAALQPVLLQLAKSGGLAQDVVDKLLGVQAAKTPWQEMESIANEFGIDLNELGMNFKNAKLGETADEFAKKFMLLVDNGAVVTSVIAGMGDEAQDFLTKALQWGTQLPASMKPVLETLLKAGKLTDENGDALTDLSRVSFAPTMEEQFDRVIAKLEELIDKIGGGLSGAFDAAASHAHNAVEQIKREFQQIPSGFDVGDQPTAPDLSGTNAAVNAVMARVAVNAANPSTSTGNVYLDGKLVGRYEAPHIIAELQRLQLTR